MDRWEAGFKINEKAKALMRKNRGLTYGEAMRQVINENRHKPYVKVYLGETTYISPHGDETNPKPKGPGIKKGKEEESKVQYVVGHPEYPDPHGRTNVGQDPRTDYHEGGYKMAQKETTPSWQQKGTLEPQMDPLEAGRRIDALIRQYLYDHPQVSYDEALAKVLSMHPDLKAAYGRTNVTFPADSVKYTTTPDDVGKFYTAPDDPEANRAVRAEVHRKVMAHMDTTGEDDYETAMEEVFAADSKLKERYAQS